MSSDNDVTLQSYNDHIQDYVDDALPNTPEDTKTWLDQALSRLSKDADILELGSGHGREADYVESQGFAVQRTDAAQGFVDLLQAQGHKARLLNALTEDYGGSYDLILAHAVLVHFTHEECLAVLTKANQSLKPGGIFAFSVKQGKGEKWSDEKIHAPRYFSYWERPELERLLRIAGITDFEILEAASRRSTWYQVITRR